MKKLFNNFEKTMRKLFNKYEKTMKKLFAKNREPRTRENTTFLV